MSLCSIRPFIALLFSIISFFTLFFFSDEVFSLSLASASRKHCSLQASHAFWKVLDFFLKIPGFGKSWKNILENRALFIGSNSKQAAIVYHPVCVAYLNTVYNSSKNFCLLCSLKYLLFFTIFKLCGLQKKSWKICQGGFEKSWKSPEFFCQQKSGNPVFGSGCRCNMSHWPIFGDKWLSPMCATCHSYEGSCDRS